MRLRGKKAIVTGGSSWIGCSIAIAFAKEGADLLITCQSKAAEAKRIGEITHDYTL